jgi:Tol biopolymer transport system component
VYQVWNYTKAVTDGAAHVIRTGARVGISQSLADGSALGTEDRGAAALWRVDLNAPRVEPEKVRGIPWTDDDLSVSPDGRWLVFSTVRHGLPPTLAKPASSPHKRGSKLLR